VKALQFCGAFILLKFLLVMTESFLFPADVADYLADFR
jgi:hypothetical protein